MGEDSSTLHQHGHVDFEVVRTSLFAANRFANRKKNSNIFQFIQIWKTSKKLNGVNASKKPRAPCKLNFEKCSWPIGFCRALASVKGTMNDVSNLKKTVIFIRVSTVAQD